MLTRTLVLALALLTAGGLWRLARWYWRPRLRLPAELRVRPVDGGIRLSLRVRNVGAGRSRGCRARFLRVERNDQGGWLRVEPLPLPAAADPDAPRACIPPHGSTTLAADALLPAEAGRYRVELAVINGEEVRASYVIDIETADLPTSP
jgi:hypothetical protein